MKSLFNKYESYNKAGGQLSDEIQKVLDPIMEAWAKKGYKIKDVESIILDNVSIKSTLIRAKRAMLMLKKERGIE